MKLSGKEIGMMATGAARRTSWSNFLIKLIELRKKCSMAKTVSLIVRNIARVITFSASGEIHHPPKNR